MSASRSSSNSSSRARSDAGSGRSSSSGWTNMSTRSREHRLPDTPAVNALVWCAGQRPSRVRKVRVYEDVWEREYGAWGAGSVYSGRSERKTEHRAVFVEWPKGRGAWTGDDAVYARRSLSRAVGGSRASRAAPRSNPGAEAGRGHGGPVNEAEEEGGEIDDEDDDEDEDDDGSFGGGGGGGGGFAGFSQPAYAQPPPTMRPAVFPGMPAGTAPGMVPGMPAMTRSPPAPGGFKTYAGMVPPYGGPASFGGPAPQHMGMPFRNVTMAAPPVPHVSGLV